jgi:hypothetical protein
MKRRFGIVITLVVAAALGTFGHAQAQSNTDVFEKLVRIMEQAAVIIDANKSNCDAMGDGLNGLIDRNAQVLSTAKALGERLTPDEKTALEARFRARINAAMGKIRPGFALCINNAKVKGALQKLN